MNTGDARAFYRASKAVTRRRQSMGTIAAAAATTTAGTTLEATDSSEQGLHSTVLIVGCCILGALVTFAALYISLVVCSRRKQQNRQPPAYDEDERVHGNQAELQPIRRTSRAAIRSQLAPPTFRESARPADHDTATLQRQQLASWSARSDLQHPVGSALQRCDHQRPPPHGQRPSNNLGYSAGSQLLLSTQQHQSDAGADCQVGTGSASTDYGGSEAAAAAAPVWSLNQKAIIEQLELLRRIVLSSYAEQPSSAHCSTFGGGRADRATSRRRRLAAAEAAATESDTQSRLISAAVAVASNWEAGGSSMDDGFAGEGLRRVRRLLHVADPEDLQAELSAEPVHGVAAATMPETAFEAVSATAAAPRGDDHFRSYPSSVVGRRPSTAATGDQLAPRNATLGEQPSVLYATLDRTATLQRSLASRSLPARPGPALHGPASSTNESRAESGVQSSLESSAVAGFVWAPTDPAANGSGGGGNGPPSAVELTVHAHGSHEFSVDVEYPLVSERSSGMLSSPHPSSSYTRSPLLSQPLLSLSRRDGC